MALIKYKPTSPGHARVIKVDRSHLHKGGPLRAAHRAPEQDRRAQPLRPHHHAPPGRRLAPEVPAHRLQARQGRHRRRGRAARVRPEPHRHIALVKYADGEWRYILAAKGMQPGDEVRSGADSPIKPGNAMSLRHIPVGSIVHNVEMKPGRGGQLARSAGASVSFTSREGIYALPAAEVRRDAQGAHRLPRHLRRGRQR